MKNKTVSAREKYGNREFAMKKKAFCAVAAGKCWWAREASGEAPQEAPRWPARRGSIKYWKLGKGVV